MKVIFSQTRGEAVTLEIEPTQNVEEVEAMLLSTGKFPNGTIKFIYMGKILSGETPFVDVKPNTRVILYIKEDKVIERPSEVIPEKTFWDMPEEINKVCDSITEDPMLSKVLSEKIKSINGKENILVPNCLDLIGVYGILKNNQPMSSDADAIMMQLSNQQRNEVRYLCQTYGLDLEVGLTVYVSANRNLDAAVQSLF